MRRAARAARTLRATTANRSGARHSVYVVLLRDRTRAQAWGLYVGQTSRDPDLRFDQHKAGYKASGPVRRFGVCLLPELTDHLNPLHQWEALDLEAALADALREACVVGRGRALRNVCNGLKSGSHQRPQRLGIATVALQFARVPEEELEAEGGWPTSTTSRPRWRTSRARRSAADQSSPAGALSGLPPTSLSPS
jgi:hypothetical protein